MINEHKISTIRNVISDLKCYLEDIEEQYPYADCCAQSQSIINQQWQDAQLACQYITENQPHL